MLVQKLIRKNNGEKYNLLGPALIGGISILHGVSLLKYKLDMDKYGEDMEEYNKIISQQCTDVVQVKKPEKPELPMFVATYTTVYTSLI